MLRLCRPTRSAEVRTVVGGDLLPGRVRRRVLEVVGELHLLHLGRLSRRGLLGLRLRNWCHRVRSSSRCQLGGALDRDLRRLGEMRLESRLLR